AAGGSPGQSRHPTARNCGSREVADGPDARGENRSAAGPSASFFSSGQSFIRRWRRLTQIFQTTNANEFTGIFPDAKSAGKRSAAGIHAPQSGQKEQNQHSET